MSERVRVILRRGKSKPFWLGHPWVFSGAIDRVEGVVPETGAPCVVEDERQNVLGTGFYNPMGKIAVRLLQHRRTTDLPFDPQPFDRLVEQRVREAAVRRQALGLPHGRTDSYRVVNAEGDHLSGLVVDKLGDAAVVHLNSRAMYEARAVVADAVRRVLGPERIIMAVGDEASRLEAIPTGVHYVWPEERKEDGAVQVLENGVRYRVDVFGGQKTGFYFDQRDNRRRFAELCEGRRLLDLYSYVGGFSLNALVAGAEHATVVDSSGPAIAAASANAQLNGVPAERLSAHAEDAMVWLKEANARGLAWDRIVCDPPKLARGRGHIDEAIKKYARLNTLAMSVLAPGGLLLTCTCSQHVSEEAFLRMLTDAGHRLRRTVHVHAVWGQAPDHPFSVVAPEGRYLTAVLISTSEG